MGIDRLALKRQSKDCIHQHFSVILPVTAVFILLTVWLPEIVDFFAANPLNTFLNDYQELYGDALMGAGIISSDMVLRLMRRDLLGTAASVGLFAALVMYIFTVIMDFGYTLHCLTLRRRGEAGMGELFRPFQIATKIILTELLQLLFVSLWTMLFIIPGIVAMYRYRQTTYLILDDPEIGPLEAIRQSKKLMAGRKGELFFLDLSFTGWALLAVAIAELGSLLLGDFAYLVLYSLCCLLLTPYTRLTQAGYYDAIRAGNMPPLNEAPSQDDPWNM